MFWLFPVVLLSKQMFEDHRLRNAVHHVHKETAVNLILFIPHVHAHVSSFYAHDPDNYLSLHPDIFSICSLKSETDRGLVYNFI